MRPFTRLADASCDPRRLLLLVEQLARDTTARAERELGRTPPIPLYPRFSRQAATYLRALARAVNPEASAVADGPELEEQIGWWEGPPR